ncbi:MAG: hypothetical protein AAF911_10215 [Planctomycetota bacterium]
MHVKALTLLSVLMVFAGCGPQTVTIDAPFPHVLQSVESLYPPPEEMLYEEWVAIPAYRIGPAAAENRRTLEFDQTDQKATIHIYNGEKLYERKTAIHLEALNPMQTRVVVDSQDWDYLRPFNKQQRDHEYQAARMREIVNQFRPTAE